MSEESSECPLHRSGEELEDLRLYGEGITYNEYLKIPELLELQDPLSDPSRHDELFFIIIHQAYELWFRQIIHELEAAIADLRNRGDTHQAMHRLDRVIEILNVLTRQIHLLETMRPIDFLEFREHLEPASGFQSLQFREVEFLLGLKEKEYLKFFENKSDEKEQLEKRMRETDLREAFYGFLREETDLSIPDDTTIETLAEQEDVRSTLVEALSEIYEHPRERTEEYQLAESLVDVDQQFGLWRDHHVRVVERMIGSKQGTGGSSGVDYLKSTTSKRFFPNLMEARTHMDKSSDPADGSEM